MPLRLLKNLISIATDMRWALISKILKLSSQQKDLQRLKSGRNQLILLTMSLVLTPLTVVLIGLTAFAYKCTVAMLTVWSKLLSLLQAK